ncbi:MAG: YraN family protein [Solirubrobacteraceae bacterium]
MPVSVYTQRLGRLGEDLAAVHYERLGYRLLERNYRTRAGELDLVVHNARATVFVEVKTRTAGGMHPFDSITYVKRTRLRRLAACWLAEHPGRAREVRFDVVGIVVTWEGELLSLEQVEIMI